MAKKIFSFFLFFYVVTGLSNTMTLAREQALWVTRWDFKSANDVVRIMENAKDLGATTVFFQVRGNATVFYPSKHEPWAWELSDLNPSDPPKDPGWDPLATAIQEAGRWGLSIQAWMNAFPAWRGTDSPPWKSNHLWRTNRSWFILDQRGRLLKPTSTFYSFLSPGIPEVREHLANVFKEVAVNYPNVDGIHLDYIRYPARNEVGRNRDFSYDKPTVDAFRKKFKKYPNPDLKEWQQFKCEQVAETIRAIRTSIRDASPTMQLSSTCVADIDHATGETGQDVRIWVENDLVDTLIPMVYKQSTPEIRDLLDSFEEFLGKEWNQHLVAGLNVDFNASQEIRRQLQHIYERNYKGEALFAYSSLFPNHRPNEKAQVIETFWHEFQLKEILIGGGE